VAIMANSICLKTTIILVKNILVKRIGQNGFSILLRAGG